MAGRAGRAGQCAAGVPRGIRNPGLTRAAQMRQAKSAAFVKEQMAKDDAEVAHTAAPCNLPRKGRVPKFTKGPPPAEPRRIDMTKPGMTKAMIARMKHAEQFARNLEKESVLKQRKRLAPIGGDARFGREPRRRIALQPSAAACTEWQPQGALQKAAASNPGIQKLLKMKEDRMAAMRTRKASSCKEASPSSVPGACPRSPARQLEPIPQAQSTMRRNGKLIGNSEPAELEPSITDKTCELAQSMNADVLQAESVGEGPVQNIVIPPGALSQCRTTIVTLPTQYDTSSTSANRSIQIITETLDEQDALEAEVVNNRLCELQHARRDFVMAIANVGGNAINLTDNSQSACSRDRNLYQLPDADDDMFRIEYGRDHPTVIAAREFAQKTKATLQERDSQMRIEREFARAARYEGGLRLDVPMEQEIMEGDISFEEDESGIIIPCASRIKASMPPIPKSRHIAAVPEAICPDELERFFNPAKYPIPCETVNPNAPPRGREGLNPDLWELDDPWYRECPQLDGPDLMDFSEY